MKRRLAYYGVRAGAVLCLLCVPVLPAAAQGVQEGKLQNPSPRNQNPNPSQRGDPHPALQTVTRTSREFGSRVQPEVSLSTPPLESNSTPKLHPRSRHHFNRGRPRRSRR
jgi:hypothetical protein